MTYLLDVSTLIALLWKTHVHHFYLAARHGMKLATLDETIAHKAVFVLPP